MSSKSFTEQTTIEALGCAVPLKQWHTLPPKGLWARGSVRMLEAAMWRQCMIGRGCITDFI